jgi:hypothetical protein
MRRRALDTSDPADAGRWKNLVEQVLACPPPYRAAAGRPVYVIHAGDRAVLVAEQDLTGPLARVPGGDRSLDGHGDLLPRGVEHHVVPGRRMWVLAKLAKVNNHGRPVSLSSRAGACRGSGPPRCA